MTTPPYPPQQHAPHGAPYGHAPAAGQPGPHASYTHAGQHPAYPSRPFGCRGCGAPAAVDFPVREHQGLLVVMRFQKVDGPFCRNCGRAVVRQMTTMTLCLGWWSPVSLALFTPFALVWNLVAHLKFGKLPESPPAPGRRPLDAGSPVVMRPLAYVALVPIFWFFWMLGSILADSP